MIRRLKAPTGTGAFARARLALIALVLAGALLASATTASAGTGYTCANATLFGGPYSELTVPPGDFCDLDGTEVTGNVRVPRGAELRTSGAVIGGNVQANDAGEIDVSFGSIGGNLQVQGATAFTDAYVVSVKGNVEVQHSGPGAAVLLERLTVGGNLQAQNNEGLVLKIAEDNVTGNLQVQNNAAPVYVERNTANGNIEVHNNNGGGTLTRNHAEGNCRSFNNEPMLGGSLNTAGHQNTCPM